MSIFLINDKAENKWTTINADNKESAILASKWRYATKNVLVIAFKDIDCGGLSVTYVLDTLNKYWTEEHEITIENIEEMELVDEWMMESAIY